MRAAVLLLALAACGARNFDLVLTAPDAAVAPVEPDVTVSVDFAASSGRAASALLYGLTAVQATDPVVAGDPGNLQYKAGMALMRPGLVRVFRGDVLDEARTVRGGWVLDPDKATYTWDAQKIGRALSGLPSGAAVMLTIPAWPVFMGPTNRALDPRHHDAFAAFAAELVRIVNVTQRRGIRYVEIFNERNEAYEGRGSAMGELYLKVARAVRAVDPAIKLGGAGFTNAFRAEIDGFIAAALPELDFVSYHGYGTGDKAAALSKIFATASSFGGLARQVREVLNRRGGQRVEIFHDQYNVNWSQDPRMNNEVGAVFDALAMIAFAGSPLTGACAWNESDGWYGKLDGAHRPRLGAHVFRLWNRFMVGTTAEVFSARPEAVTGLGVRAEGGGRSVALVNQDDAPHTVSVRVPPPLTGTATVHQVSAAGALERTQAVDAPVTLPALSVTVLQLP